jgi:ankyrin
MGSDSSDIKIEEIQRNDKTSVVHIKAYKRGYVADAAMFELCSLATISKNRGYRYFVVLKEKKLINCKECEWSNEKIVGFLNSKTDLNRMYFGTDYKSSAIVDINQFAMVCGFMPIPSSKFHMAVYFGDLETVKELLEKDRKLINKKDNNGFKPLHLASTEDRKETLNYLISSGADINGKASHEIAPGITALHLAVMFDKVDIIKILLNNKADPESKTETSGNTPLHNAASFGNIEIAKLLLKAGANVDVNNNYGYTPLHNAASFGNIEIAKLLLKAGADVDVNNNYGHTPLHDATNSRQINMVRYLLENGANPNKKSVNGESPLTIAKSRKYKEIITALEENRTKKQ